MTLTLKELEIVAAEVSAAICGYTLSAVNLLAPDTVVLCFHKGPQEARVLFCVRPRFSRMHLYSGDLVQQSKAPRHPFLSVAKRFFGCEVTAIKPAYNDRVIRLEFREHTKEKRGSGHSLFGYLIFECTGHHPNLFWTKPNEMILASLVPSRSYKRDLRPGQKYQRPLPQASDFVESLRFLPGPSQSASSQIQEYYERLLKEEARRVEEASARREIRREIERLTRLREGLERDLEEQEQAAQALESMRPPYPDRLKRLAGRCHLTRERIERLKRKIERLSRELELQVSPQE